MAQVHQVTKWKFVNCYLVVEDDGLTLVDTMLPRSTPTILAAAEQLGAPITRIALTHAHGDHIGSLDALHAALPDAEVIISTRDARLLGKDMTLDPGEPATKLRGDYRGAQTHPTRTVEPGERIGSLEVVASPGHTPGHVSYFDTRDATLYTGDAYATWGGKTSTAARGAWRFPFVSGATWNKPTALASARRLRELNPARLAPGHGAVREDPIAAMDAAIRRGA